MKIQKKCSVEGCGKKLLAKGLCCAHYCRLVRTGEVGSSVTDKMKRGEPCLVDGCANLSVSKGYCTTHYGRLKRTGSPTGGVRSIRGSAEKWMDAHVSFDGNECLIWPFSRYASGYGCFYSRRDNKTTNASRVMCVRAHGAPPSSEHQAAHSCGNGHLGCTNPKHLRWATTKENSDDMIAHGNSPRGRRHGMSKLTESDVIAIRGLAIETSANELSKEFGVCASHIRAIVKGDEWSWLRSSHK